MTLDLGDEAQREQFVIAHAGDLVNAAIDRSGAAWPDGARLNVVVQGPCRDASRRAPLSTMATTGVSTTRTELTFEEARDALASVGDRRGEPPRSRWACIVVAHFSQGYPPQADLEPGITSLTYAGLSEVAAQGVDDDLIVASDDSCAALETAVRAFLVNRRLANRAMLRRCAAGVFEACGGDQMVVSAPATEPEEQRFFEN